MSATTCYVNVLTKMTQADASAACASSGGQLMVYNDGFDEQVSLCCRPEHA